MPLVLFCSFTSRWLRQSERTLEYSFNISGSRYDTISGRPDELFFLPDLHGGEDGLLHPILDDEIQSIRENLTYEEEQTIYQEYFEYVLENTDLQLPNNFEQGLSLYKQLLEIANID